MGLAEVKKELKKLQKQIDISSFEKDVVKEKWLNLLNNEWVDLYLFLNYTN